MADSTYLYVYETEAFRRFAIAYARKSRMQVVKEMISDMKMLLLKMLRRIASTPRWVILPLTLGMLLCLLLIPQPAFADFPFQKEINDFLSKTLYAYLGDAAASFFNTSFWMLSRINSDNIISGSFDGLMGTAAANVATMTRNIAESAVKPVANVIFAMMVLVKLLQIASQMDKQGGTMPAVREVFILFVYFAIGTMLINNAASYMQAIFEVGQQLIRNINDQFQVGQEIVNPNIKFTNIVDFGTGAVILIFGVLVVIISVVAAVAVQFMGLMRAFEIYLLTMFAPLPFAFLFYDGTKQWGIGYLKNYASVCLSGAVLIVCTYLFPMVWISYLPQDGAQLQLKDLTWFIPMVASVLLLIIVTLKSGSIASKILGGA